MTLAADEKYCPSCGEAIKEAAVRCPECGVRDDGTTAGANASGARTVYCESCGDQINAAAEICPNCGVRQAGSPGSGSVDSSDVGELLYYGQIALGALLLLAAIGSLTDADTGVLASVGQALVYAVVGLALLPQVRDRLEKRHPVTTFGRTRGVREVPVSNSGQQCSNCLDDVDSGIRREYGSELVVAGVVLTEDREGANHYCEACYRTEQRVEAATAAVDEGSV